MPPIHMRGMTAVRRQIAKYLKDAYPDYRRRALQSWQVSGVEVPEIMVYSPFDLDVVATNQKPSLGIEGRRVQGFRGSDTIDGANEYRPVYSMQAVIGLHSPNDVSGTSVDQAKLKVTRQRDDMMAILRACLLDRPSLGSGDALEFLEATLVEEYQEAVPTGANTQRYFITGSLLFDVRVDETLLHFPLNDPTKPNVFDVEVEVTALPDPLYGNVNHLP